MRQSEKIKYMLTTELTEDELKNVIHYSFSNRPIDTKLWYELLDKLDLTDEDITTDFHDKIKNTDGNVTTKLHVNTCDNKISLSLNFEEYQSGGIKNTSIYLILELLKYDIEYFNTYGYFFNSLYS